MGFHRISQSLIQISHHRKNSDDAIVWCYTNHRAVTCLMKLWGLFSVTKRYIVCYSFIVWCHHGRGLHPKLWCKVLPVIGWVWHNNRVELLTIIVEIEWCDFLMMEVWIKVLFDFADCWTSLEGDCLSFVFTMPKSFLRVKVEKSNYGLCFQNK